MSSKVCKDEIMSDHRKLEELNKQFKECMEKNGGSYSNERMIENYLKCKIFLDESRKIINKK